jgi:uncharacterized protein YgbK (DUF1537 family)
MPQKEIIMKAYGYTPTANAEIPSKLSEVSLFVNLDELQDLIDFLQNVQHEHTQVKSADTLNHSHLKDWKKDHAGSDLIIVTKS